MWVCTEALNPTQLLLSGIKLQMFPRLSSRPQKLMWLRFFVAHLSSSKWLWSADQLSVKRLVKTCGRFRKQSGWQRWRSFSGSVPCSCKHDAGCRMTEAMREKHKSNEAAFPAGSWCVSCCGRFGRLPGFLIQSCQWTSEWRFTDSERQMPCHHFYLWPETWASIWRWSTFLWNTVASILHKLQTPHQSEYKPTKDRFMCVTICTTRIE